MRTCVKLHWQIYELIEFIDKNLTDFALLHILDVLNQLTQNFLIRLREFLIKRNTKESKILSKKITQAIKEYS